MPIYNLIKFKFNPYAIPPLFTATTLLIIALIVFLKGARTYLKTVFALFCLSISIWLFGFSAMYLSPDKNIALIWARIGFYGVLFIPTLAYHFILIFTQSKKRFLLTTLYAYSIPILLLISTNYIYKDIAIYFWGYYPVAGSLYFIFVIAFFCIFTWSVILLFFALHDYKKKNNIVKAQQTKYVIAAFIIAIPATMDYIIKYKIEIYPYGYIMTLIFISILAYAIVKHKLLDINIVIRKTLIYSLLIGIIAVIFTISIIFFEYILKQTIGYSSIFFTLCTAMIIAILFQPLNRKITTFIDRIFFKKSIMLMAEDNKRLEEELQRSEKLAALGIMASGLAHEIKNPLVPIKTYIQNLPDHLTEIDKNSNFIRKITTTIPKEVDKITDLLRQLRDFAQPPPLNISKINIHNLLDDKLSFLEEEFTKKNIKIEKSYNDTPIIINGDFNQLERVFLNLLLNAIDAMPDGGNLMVSTEITPDNKTLIKISDTGIGIAKEDLPHIFDPFFSKGKQKGSGLGLAITYQTIKGHNGIIHADNIQGKETTFSIYLPIS